MTKKIQLRPYEKRSSHQDEEEWVCERLPSI